MKKRKLSKLPIFEVLERMEVISAKILLDCRWSKKQVVLGKKEKKEMEKVWTGKRKATN